MRISKVLLICMCCLLAVPAVWGQAANSQANHGILGYLDPQTGAFRMLPAVDNSVEPPALTTFTGTINLTITVAVKTTGITNVICTMSVSVDDALTSGSPRIFGESDTVAATGTGTTRTCKLSIPYSWALSTQASDSMTTDYTVTGAASTTGTTPPIRSTSLSPYDTRKVPANGAITTLTAASATI
jgi:hypothetical protein